MKKITKQQSEERSIEEFGAMYPDLFTRLKTKIQLWIEFYEQKYKDDEKTKQQLIKRYKTQRVPEIIKTLLYEKEYYKNDPALMEYMINSTLSPPPEIKQHLADHAAFEAKWAEMEKNPDQHFMTRHNRRKFIKDWQRMIPNMRIDNYYKMSMRKRIGPFLFSVDLYKEQSFNDRYWPMIYINLLLKPTNNLVCGNLESPFNEITIQEHNDRKYLAAIEHIKSNYPFFMKDNLSIQQLCNYYEKTIYANAQHGSSYWANIPALCAAWAGDQSMAHKYYDLGYNFGTTTSMPGLYWIHTSDFTAVDLQNCNTPTVVHDQKNIHYLIIKTTDSIVAINQTTLQKIPRFIETQALILETINKIPVDRSKATQGIYCYWTDPIMQWITSQCGHTYKNTSAFKLWAKELWQQINNPEQVRQQVKEEVKRLKLESIPFYNIVGAEYQES